ncbi:MAG: hypothetical protein SFY32_01880 [Bacteroidota bacterium]|nr:hypothetical protein [Bacteroidota bacterium]
MKPLPNAFKTQIVSFLREDSDAFFESLTLPAPVSIRINPKKNIPINKFKSNIQWCSNGYYLQERPLFTVDPLFHAGAYYVQEASSMFIEQILLQLDLTKPNLTFLDLCAAPGGKSTHLLSLIDETSLLVANETIKPRAMTLKDNLARWGNSNYIVSNSDPKSFGSLSSVFDVILIDAPCSGEGMFRKDPDAINEWSENNVELSSQRQKRILEDVLPSLKEEGIIIYCTCTYNEVENESNVQHLIQNHNATLLNEQIQITESWNIVKNNLGFRFFPHKVSGEGFFVSVLKINKQVPKRTSNLLNPYFKKLSVSIQKTIQQLIRTPKSFEFYEHDKDIYAVETKFSHIIEKISKHVFVFYPGLYLGQIINNQIIPSHELALSIEVNISSEVLEINSEVAYQYFKRNDISQLIDLESIADGWVLLTYQNIPIGWIKKMKFRINNYYPKEMRILRDF